MLPGSSARYPLGALTPPGVAGARAPGLPSDPVVSPEGSDPARPPRGAVRRAPRPRVRAGNPPARAPARAPGANAPNPGAGAADRPFQPPTPTRLTPGAQAGSPAPTLTATAGRPAVTRIPKKKNPGVRRGLKKRKKLIHHGVGVSAPTPLPQFAVAAINLFTEA